MATLTNNRYGSTFQNTSGDTRVFWYLDRGGVSLADEGTYTVNGHFVEHFNRIWGRRTAADALAAWDVDVSAGDLALVSTPVAIVEDIDSNDGVAIEVNDGAFLASSVVNETPTVDEVADVSSDPVTGTTVTLTALGEDDAGEPSLSYTWTATTIPDGASQPTYSANGTNGAKSSTATFDKAGDYVFQVTIADAQSLTVTSSVSVTVNQTLTTLTVSPSTASKTTGQTQQFTVAGVDQFGDVKTLTGTVWSVDAHGTINSSSGLFTAGTAGDATVTATNGVVTDNAIVTVS